MRLRLVFLLITQVITWLRLSRREDAWKTAEILILRHQLTVRQRHQAYGHGAPPVSGTPNRAAA